MAGDSRTLKLAILGEVKDLSDNLKKGSDDVNSLGDKMTKFGKVAATAFAVAATAALTYAGKLAIDGVKAAIEDEAAQDKLATTLKNVTGATDDQITAVEDYITKTTLATGVSDDLLRPSLDRLVRSTNNVEEAQKLQAIALDISAGTGKDLTAVSDALAKAQDGNLTSLTKLGVGIDKAEFKTMNFEEITAKLADTFENQATKQAETFKGKMDRLKAAFDEGKETVGVFILDAITPMVTTIVDKVIPAVQDFIDGVGGKDGIKAKFDEFVDLAKRIFIPIFDGIRSAFDKIKDAVGDNKESFQTLFKFLKDYVAPFLGNVLGKAIDGIGTAISIVIDLVAKLIDAFKFMFTLGSKVAGFVGGAFGGGKASGGPVAGGTTYLVGEQGPELFTPSAGGYIVPNNKLGGGGNNTVINVTVNGAVDPISTARQIANILNREATLSGSFNKVGSSLLVGV